MKRTSLDQLAGITPGIRKGLNDLNIRTVEELIAYYEAIGKNSNPLATALAIPPKALDLIIQEAMKIIPGTVLNELFHNAAKKDMPFGAFNPEELPENQD